MSSNLAPASAWFTFLRLAAVLALSLFLTSPVAAQKINATNSLVPEISREIQIAFGSRRSDSTRYQILARHPAAGLRNYDLYDGIAIKINQNNTSLLDRTSVAFVSCDSSGYTNFIGPIDVLASTINRGAAPAPVAVILYSDVQNGCDWEPGPRVDNTYYHLYTLTVPAANLIMLNNGGSTVTIARKSLFETNGTDITPGNAGPSAAPGGPSPSTAVAMIILYSITGVITALFLIIIVTGAIRAHRHPERYGPRNALGRPRQSRARGLARAMLETLPIVKFGEDEKKPTDVELAGATTTEVKNVRDSTISEADGADPVAKRDTEDAKKGEHSEAQKSEVAAPAPVPDEALGCSICTDDFEIGQDVRVLPCNHHFHPACIDPWLLNVSGTCPLCRIDLRPTTATNPEESADATGDEVFPPPLDPAEQARRASRRHSLIWDILNPTRMRDASAQERIVALRRVREERRLSNVEETEARRRRRLTARFQDVFHIRTTGSNSSVSPSPVIAGGMTSSPIERIAESPSEISPVATGLSTSRLAESSSDWPVSRPISGAHTAPSSTPLRPTTPVAPSQRPEPASPSAVALPPSPTNSTKES